MIDQVVSGRYKVECEIGSGGMGVVYRALDTKLRRAVALKVIAPNLVEDEEARTHFLQEAQALAGLSHPNIVTVFDLAEEPETGTVFIVMELLNGLPLRKRITDPTRPTFHEMAIQVCRALEHAHSHGVLHRDIKPENIFVCADGTVKLMDFGLARLVDGAAVNSSGMVNGTVAYMSPEQLRGGPLDPRTDLYGLGVLFYEYLCGFTPFMSDSPGTMLLKHLTEAPQSLLDRVPGLSPELDALILVLLAKDPKDRYPSAMILRDSLERIRDRGPVASVPMTAPKSAGPAMPAALIPIVAPRSRTLKKTTTIRPVAGPRPQMGRFVAIFCVILLGAVLAFAVGETLHRIFVPGSLPAAKTGIATKTGVRKQRTSGSRRRRYRAQYDGTPAGSGPKTTGQAATSAKPALPHDGDASAPVDPPADDNASEDKGSTSEPDSGAAGSSKSEPDSSG